MLEDLRKLTRLEEEQGKRWISGRRKREVENATENEREAWKPLRIERKQSLLE
jgi:hypothetical protein